jgi:translocation and assembly module TamB
MSGRGRVLWITAASLVSLVILLLIAALITVQTGWFRNFVREKIVSAVEEAVGGKAEIASFTFEVGRLRANVDNFVLHGTEPSNVAPLFRARRLVADLKLFSPSKGVIDIAYLLLDTPQTNLIVFPDGRTNLPTPPKKQSSNSDGLQSVVNLGVGRFELRNGSLAFANRKTDFSASGRNLRAELRYNLARPGYVGELDVSPLELKAAGNAPLNVDVKLPVTIEADRMALDGGRLSTAESAINISASMDHLAAPRTSGHLSAQLALGEIRRAAGLTTPLDTVRGPSRLDIDIRASSDDQRVAIENATLTLGQSSIKASGPLRRAGRPDAIQFSAVLMVSEIGRLLRVAAQPGGTIRADGSASVDAAANYTIRANVKGRNLSAGQGAARVTNASLDSSITADPRRVEVGGLRVTVLGGSLRGSGALEDTERFRFSGRLDNFDINGISQIFKKGGFGYSGAISGDVQAEGNTKDSSQLAARAALAIQPRAGGIPVSGRVNVDYSGRADTVTVASSYLALPNTRLDLSGSLGQQIQINLVTRSAGDFRPVASVPLAFANGGNGIINATISGAVSAPRIAGSVTLTSFSVAGREFTSFTAGLAASPSSASVRNATLTRGRMQAQANASVGLRSWTPAKDEAVRVDVTVRQADVADLLAIAGQSQIPARGDMVGDIHIGGTVSTPVGTADLTVSNGMLQGEHFDRLSTRVLLTSNAIEVPSLEWIAGPSRLDANAAYQHAPNDLRQGTLRAHVASNQVQLAQFQPLLKDRPEAAGVISVNADAGATVGPAPNGVDFQLTALNANLSARGLKMQGKDLGDATVTAATSGSTLQYNMASNFLGARIRIEGQSQLAGDHQTRASAEIVNLPIDRALAIAGRSDLPVSGTLTLDGQVSGTLAEPRGTMSLNVANGSAYQQPFNRLQVSGQYSNRQIELSQFSLQDGPNNIEASGSFVHSTNNFREGQIQFRVSSNRLQLARIHAIRDFKAGLTGGLEVSAEGAGSLRANAAPEFAMLNANIRSEGLAVNGKAVGDASVTAESRGQQAVFRIRSNFASSDIRGDGTVGLAGDNPLDAKLSFSNVTYSGLGVWLGSPASGFDASADGQITVRGPAARVAGLSGSLQLTKLEAHSVNTGKTAAKPRTEFEVHNQGPVVMELDRSVISVRSARITGPFNNFSLSGSAPLQEGQPINLRADGNIQMKVLEALDSSVFSSGAVTLSAAVTGTRAKPSVNGRLQLQNVSLNMADVPNGISGANGAIAFTGTNAVLQNITAESGGGKITLSGLVGYGGPELNFRIQARADRIHIRYPETVTTQVSAQLALDGTTSNSLVSGTVRISEVALHSHSDFGSILNSAATPPSSPAQSSGLLAGMKFDIQVLTTSGVQFRTALAQNLQADAKLTLRGTPDHPGMLGRVTVSQGQLVFFGSKYNVDQGTISFFDANQIQPILNVSLSTTVQGVQVTLSVSGPADKMRLSYHSDPPLEFKDIVSLLGSGKPPTSDPVLAARETPPPQQSFAQAGASMLLGQAVANPVSGRLQRLFGVSKLKIDPQVSGGSSTPGATLTLEQQVNNSITFTYIQNVTQSNPQSIRVEWALDPQWSAILGRDLTGEVNLDLFYKKRFH